MEMPMPRMRDGMLPPLTTSACEHHDHVAVQAIQTTLAQGTGYWSPHEGALLVHMELPSLPMLGPTGSARGLFSGTSLAWGLWWVMK